MSSREAVVAENVARGVTRIRLNRPESLNAINVELLDALVNALRIHAQSRVIILEGAGDRAFCSGEDLKETLAPRTGGAEELRESLLKLQDITRLISATSVIVIAAVHGYAVGGGAEIALAADFVIGGTHAGFRFPEASIGHAVTGGISARLPQLVGLLKAKELLLTGRLIDAQEALRIGLLTEISEDPKSRAFELALELAARPVVALEVSKSSLERAVFPLMESVLHDEVSVASYCFEQGAAKDAFGNFAARQKTSLLPSAVDKAVLAPKTKHESPHILPAKDINSAWSQAVKRWPSRIFMRFDGKDITYATFDELVSTLVGGLRHHGVESGDRVLVMMKNSIEMACSWLATNRLGAVWVPVNSQLKSVTLAHVVSAAAARLAIVDAELLSTLVSVNVVPAEKIWVHGGIQQANDLADLSNIGQPLTAPAPVSASSPSAFLYTSGTTGKSKPCMLSHGYFLSAAKTLIAGCDLNTNDVLFCPFPLFHIDATALTIIPAILLGATAALSVRYSASKFWDEIRASEATVYDFMGATLALTFKQPPLPRDREHNVRLAWGVPMPSFGSDYEARFGHPLVTLYGSLETGLPVFQDRGVGALPRGSCGRIRPGFELRIANDDDEEVAVGTPGQMLFRARDPSTFFDGYFNQPNATISTFRNLWLHTGDIGRVDAEGNVSFLGRMKDVVRRRGENINAAEVEEEFLQHDAVEIAVAHGIPSELGEGTEEDLKVVVQVRQGNGGISEADLWGWSVKRVARHQVPNIVQIVDEIQRTETGKVVKHGLPVGGGQRFDIRSIEKN
jgi:acyl-CoA synthetase (AMP-forming)/AMP-acid ligase II/enoyl-CoA hydratase/carnithine racemase